VDALNLKIMAYRMPGKGTKITVGINLLDTLGFREMPPCRRQKEMRKHMKHKHLSPNWL